MSIQCFCRFFSIDLYPSVTVKNTIFLRVISRKPFGIFQYRHCKRKFGEYRNMSPFSSPSFSIFGTKNSICLINFKIDKVIAIKFTFSISLGNCRIFGCISFERTDFLCCEFSLHLALHFNSCNNNLHTHNKKKMYFWIRKIIFNILLSVKLGYFRRICLDLQIKYLSWILPLWKSGLELIFIDVSKIDRYYFKGHLSSHVQSSEHWAAKSKIVIELNDALLKEK